MSPTRGGAFDFLKSVDPHRLSSYLRDESPRIAGVVLAHSDPTLSAKVLADFPVDLQKQVVTAMRGARETAPLVLEEVAATLKERLSSPRAAPKPSPAPQPDTATGELPRPEKAPENAEDAVQYGGPEVAAAILRYAPAETRRLIQENEPALFASLRKLMYTFDDFIKTPERSLEIVFSEMNAKTVAYALKAASPDLRRKVLGSVSRRRAQIIQDELSNLQRVRMRDIEEAQQKIVDSAMELQRQGKIIVDPDEAVA